VLGSSIIVFREVLEAALIVTIILAVTRGVKFRAQWISAGIASGIAGAIVVAMFAGTIASLMDGVGHEIFNASVLLAAVLMLAWHNVWMSSHGRELANQMKAVGQKVSDGDLHMFALASAVGLAVLREGSEVVLFLNSMFMAGSSSQDLIGGTALGISGGVLIGLTMYFGLVAIPLKHFFKVTGWLILLLASGLAASAAGFLEQAGFLPVVSSQVWDTSTILSEQSIIGQLAHTLIGYQAQPTGIALIAWIITFCTILFLMKYFNKEGPRPQPNNLSAAVTETC